MVIVYLLAVLSGCSATPSESMVEKAIIDYFKKSRYNVVELRIAKIAAMELSEKTYMGTPGYDVTIISIVLESMSDRGTAIRKGQRLAFTNAIIRLVQDSASKNTWHVSIISGISAL